MIYTPEANRHRRLFFTPTYCLGRADVYCFLAIARVAFIRPYYPCFLVLPQFENRGTDINACAAANTCFLINHRALQNMPPSEDWPLVKTSCLEKPENPRMQQCARVRVGHYHSPGEYSNLSAATCPFRSPFGRPTASRKGETPCRGGRGTPRDGRCRGRRCSTHPRPARRRP
jgi:hypothetical protein